MVKREMALWLGKLMLQMMSQQTGIGEILMLLMELELAMFHGHAINIFLNIVDHAGLKEQQLLLLTDSIS